MKRLLLSACLALACLAPLRAQDAPVNTNADLSEVARGYATAFKHMVQNHVVVYYKVDGKTYSLTNIVAVEADDAIVVFKFTGEDHLAISASALLMMTDSQQLEKPTADEAVKPSS